MSAPATCVPERLDYETAKRLARHLDGAVRQELAARSDAMPEILFFLVADADDGVREGIARNPFTPRAAQALLARDTEASVRVAMAESVSHMIPDGAAGSPVEAAVAAILVDLSNDARTEVRAALSEAIKFLAAAPRTVARRLAGDEELAVAEPMLRHSPALREDDLLAIARDAPRPGVLGAIARRNDLPSEVADVVAHSEDVEAVTVLLTNKSAQIREETLDAVLDRAPQHSAWHRPLVERPSLPPKAVSRLAEFVALSLIDLLQSRTDLTPEGRVALAETLARRVRDEMAKGGKAPADAPSPPVGPAPAAPAPAAQPAAAPPTAARKTPDDPSSPVSSAIQRAQTMLTEGTLDDATVDDAILVGDRAFAVAGVTALAQIHYGVGDLILQSQSARGIVALAWRAGLPMSLAVKMQLTLGRIPPGKVLMPDANGGYPLGRDIMEWQLQFFGVA